jgi:hypothetical protein
MPYGALFEHAANTMTHLSEQSAASKSPLGISQFGVLIGLQKLRAQIHTWRSGTASDLDNREAEQLIVLYVDWRPRQERRDSTLTGVSVCTSPSKSRICNAAAACREAP